MIARSTEGGFRGEDEQDKNLAIATTKYVLENLAKVYAPVMPFVAEEIWQKVTENNFKDENKSVHLEDWVERGEVNEELIEEMEVVRTIISLGLEIRAKEGVKVRQPLQKLKVKNEKLKEKDELGELIKDELNVKEFAFDENIENEVELDLGITPELEKEGDFREFLRNIQIFRKDSGLKAHDEINLVIKTDNLGKELLEKFEDELKRVAGIKEIQFVEVNDGKEIVIKEYNFKIKII